MKTRIMILLAAFVIAAACNNGTDRDAVKDSANTLNDTFPAKGTGDTIGLDSNPADQTKTDSGNRAVH
jgi:hypothetical protein